MWQTSFISSLNLFLVSLLELPAPQPQCWLCSSPQSLFCQAQQAKFSLPSPTRKLPARLQIPAAHPGPVLSLSLVLAEQICTQDILRCHQSIRNTMKTHPAWKGTGALPGEIWAPFRVSPQGLWRLQPLRNMPLWLCSIRGSWFWFIFGFSNLKWEATQDLHRKMQTHLERWTLNMKSSIVNSLCHPSTQKAKTSFGNHAKALLKPSLSDVPRGGVE